MDFFEVTVEVEGKRQKVWKFVMRLMYSGRDFVWLYDRCNQIAFLDGHVRAFAHFDGVSRRGIYDNLTAAVTRRLGLEAKLTTRFLALCSHYLFEPCFARPGEGHDKGGVEAADYSLPSYLACLPAMAHVGVSDIILECRGETVVLEKAPRGGRNIRYRNYLNELARKPQAVRQVSSRLFSELGEPHQQLWRPPRHPRR